MLLFVKCGMNDESEIQHTLQSWEQIKMIVIFVFKFSKISVILKNFSFSRFSRKITFIKLFKWIYYLNWKFSKWVHHFSRTWKKGGGQVEVSFKICSFWYAFMIVFNLIFYVILSLKTSLLRSMDLWQLRGEY